MMLDEYEFLKTTVSCPYCGEEATINIHTEHGEIIDYFYECVCGKIIEQEDVVNE